MEKLFDSQDCDFSYCTDTPFNQLPVLEVDGVSIVQTKTILAYLGKRLGRWKWVVSITSQWIVNIPDLIEK